MERQITFEDQIRALSHGDLIDFVIWCHQIPARLKEEDSLSVWRRVRDDLILMEAE